MYLILPPPRNSQYYTEVGPLTKRTDLEYGVLIKCYFLFATMVSATFLGTMAYSWGVMVNVLCHGLRSFLNWDYFKNIVVLLKLYAEGVKETILAKDRIDTGAIGKAGLNFRLT